MFYFSINGSLFYNFKFVFNKEIFQSSLGPTKMNSMLDRLSAKPTNSFTFPSHGFNNDTNYFFYWGFPFPFKAFTFILVNYIDRDLAFSCIAPFSAVILSKFSSIRAFLCMSRDITVSVFSLFLLTSRVDFKELQTFTMSLLEGTGTVEGTEGGDSGWTKLKSTRLESSSSLLSFLLRLL